MNSIGDRYSILNIYNNIELNKRYKAKDLYENKIVLLKMINHNHNICEGFVRNLIDENTTIRYINSPYILNMIDVGVDSIDGEKIYYMVYEYNSGTTLNNIINNKELEYKKIVEIGIQILKGLEDAKEHGIYHGDLNPENIFVDDLDNIKILGFGTVKANDGVNTRSSNNIKYLSPYQLCINHTDIESDLFALGIILFECVFKRLPFGESNDEEQMLAFIDKGVDFKELEGICESEELVNIIKKLLNRNEKYPTFRDVIIDLSSIIYEEDLKQPLLIETDLKDNKKVKVKRAKFFISSIVMIIIVSILTTFI